MVRIVALLICAAPFVIEAAPPESLRRPQQGGDYEAPLVARRRLSSSATALAPAEDQEEHYIHLGCFANQSDYSALGKKFVQDDMTAELCHGYCNVRGAFYMATQNGNECYCNTADDFDYSRHGTGVCDQSCAGDESERCGGYSSFELYELISSDASTDPEYVDCYADSEQERVMSDKYVNDDMASTVCRDYCEGKGALYYATQYGNECWCGFSDIFADYEKHGPGTCNIPCAGDESETCGGLNALSLYRFIGDSPVPASTPKSIPELIPKSILELKSGVFPYDGTTFTGDGTYYGETSNGNCAIRSPIPSMYNGMIPVALNNDQYGGSEMCGACIEGEGSGIGAGADPITGSFKAYVMDKCPECASGSLDFSESGDGRWEISWRFVPCPGGSDTPSFIFEGSHVYYWKIQARGTKTPVEELTVAGAPGTKTDDNFFEIWGAPYPLNGPQTVETKTILGATATQEVSL